MYGVKLAIVLVLEMYMEKATIRGLGMYAPENVVRNAYFNELYQKDIDTFLRENRNVYERRYMSDDQTTSDLIVPAAEEAIKNAGISKEDIDLIIVSTDTPDYLSPSTASVVQHKLGIKGVGFFDVNTACAGFVYALDIASKFIVADKNYRNILVAGAYGMSRYINWQDHRVATLMADGAGAAIISRSAEGDGQILATQTWGDGQYHDYMGIYGGGTYRPTTHEVLESRGHLLDFGKRIPAEVNGEHWPRLTKSLLQRIGRDVNEIAHFFITQINIGMIHETLTSLEVPHEKSHNIMDRYGYTGSACIAMAMADAAMQRKLRKGDLVFLLGSGGGVSMAAMAIEWGYDT